MRSSKNTSMGVDFTFHLKLRNAALQMLMYNNDLLLFPPQKSIPGNAHIP